MTGSLLATKLYIPAARPGVITRPRLIERLNQGVACKLILVAAPAGFGKTTLLAEWVRQGRTPVAWVTLDPEDNDPARFWTYLVAALQTLKGGPSDDVLSLIQSPQPAPVETVVTTLINELVAITGQFFLVLDDYHLIEAEAVHAGVAFLLDHLPPRMHVVIATRADPPLPVARLRARGQLVELREADLRFTPAEAGEFLTQAGGLRLPRAQVEALAARTEGWIAGLQLAAVSLHDQADSAAFIRSFTGTHRYIADYLADEVLDRLPAALRDFLLRTSILDSLTGPLCDAITGQSGGQPTLERLHEANLFVLPLDDERRWFRYHRLFQDLLRQRLGQQQPALIPDLHRRASQWYEAAGLIHEAITHALAVGDADRAACLVESVAEATIMRSEVATFRRWIEALPAEQVRARPMLCVLDALALLLNRHPLDAILTRLQEAEAAIAAESGPPSDASRTVRGAVATLRGTIAIFQGDARRTREESRQALALLPEASLFLRGYTANNLSIAHFLIGDIDAALVAMDESVQINLKIGNVMIAVGALCNLAGMIMAHGQLHRAEQLLQQAMTLATDRQGRLLPIAGKALLTLGELYREWYDLDAAVECFSRGIELAGRYGEITAFIGYISLARIRQAQGDLTEAQRLVEIARRFAEEWDSTQMDDLLVDAVQVRLWLGQGDVESALEWVATRGLDTFLDGQPPPPPETGAESITELREAEYLTLARVLLAAGRTVPALDVLDGLLEAARTQKRRRRIIELQVWRALALQALNRLPAARDALAEALTLGQPEGYVWTFVEAGTPIARLLYQAADGDVAPAYARRLLTHIPAAQTAKLRPPKEMVEPLSERELEVLRLVADGLSNQEIAQVLVLALSTVKWHASNIYGKLNARNRTQAIARARALGVLPPD